MSGPLIIAADLAPADFAWLDRIRRTHFSPERNQLSAHLTMFYGLPPSAETEAKRILSLLAAQAPPAARIAGVINLGNGVAFRIESEGLEQIRWQIAEHFHGSLTAQDSQGWVPHVTIQNKVEPDVARSLYRKIEADFSPHKIGIAGLSLNRYLGGPWDRIAGYSFRGT